MPLLAPANSVITLTSAAAAVPTNGTAQLIAQVLEPSGTPPHSGTHIIFTTTLGTIEPSEAETDINGRAIVIFRAGLANGTAVITASSGGSAISAANGLRIAVGNAAVGSLQLFASPTTLPAGGGSSTISATVFDISGNVLPGVAVAFATDIGAIGPSASTTNNVGVATTILTTSATAKVTATAGSTSTGGGTAGSTGTTGSTGSTGGTSGGPQTRDITVRVNIGPTISLTGPTGAVAAGQPVLVTLGVTAPTGSQTTIRNIVVNWGDGQQTQVGTNAATLSHVYFAPGTYTVVATATDANGDTSQAVTSIVVGPRALPTVSVTPTPTNGTTSTIFSFAVTAGVPTGSNASIQNVHLDFGDGTGVDLGAATSTSIPHQYGSGGTKTIRATVTDTNGATNSAATQVIVQ